MTMQCICFSMIHEAKQMLGKLLLVNQRELELGMINMTNQWLKAMNHVENI